MKNLTILLKKIGNIKSHYDYIIVGQGLAGTILHFHFLERGKQVLVIDNNQEKNSSLVAAGMYNPIVFKRVTKGWNVDKYSPYLSPFYEKMEKLLSTQLDFPINILRFFKNLEQQNDFFSKTEEDGFSQYLVSQSSAKVDHLPVKNEVGFGEITKTGWVNTVTLMTKYKDFLIKENQLLNEKFDFDQLVFTDYKVSYKGISAEKIFFCEGTQMTQNPYFNYLPLVPTKGELFTIKVPGLEVDKILNKGFFCLPLGNELFRVGATYNWKDLTYDTTEAGKNELLEKLESLLKCEFEIVDHQAGIRPTVRDRRPLVGFHPDFPSLGLFNGLGTKGVLIAPWLANHFCDTIENNSILDREYDLQRVKKRK